MKRRAVLLSLSILFNLFDAGSGRLPSFPHQKLTIFDENAFAPAVQWQRNPYDAADSMKREAAKLLAETLKKSVVFTLSVFLDDFNHLRKQLTSPNEIDLKYFIEAKVLGLFDKTQKGERLMVGFSGSWASGKTTAAEWMRDHLRRTMPGDSVDIRSFLGDDFLREKGDRSDPNTTDPYVKFDVPAFAQFCQNLKAGKRATKPMYDQTAKGQLKFGTNAEGDLVIYNGDVSSKYAVEGNRTITIHLNSDSTFDYKEMGLTKDGLEDITELRSKEDGRPITGLHSTEFKCGETAVRIVRGKSGEITVTLRENQFHFRPNAEGKLELLTSGEPPWVLQRGEKVPALDVWDPPPSHKRQLIIGDFILLLESSDWDITAMVNVSFKVRLLRAIQRTIRQGKGMAAVSKEIDKRIGLQLTEDLPIIGLHENAVQSSRAQHYEISNMSLAELLHHAIHSGQLLGSPQGWVQLFHDAGLDLEHLLTEFGRIGTECLLDWISALREGHSLENPFKRPTFLGEKDLTPAEEMRRYWTGTFRTFGAGSGEGALLLKFMWQPEGASLSQDMEQKLSALMARGRGLFVDSMVLDMSGQAAAHQFPVEIMTSADPEERQRQAIDLKKTLISNMVPFVENTLNSATPQERRKIIDEFFDLQHRMWRRGIIDMAPHLPYRYGYKMDDGVRSMQSVAPSGIVINNNEGIALAVVQQLAEAQNQTPLDPKYQNNNDDNFIEGYGRLSGYQRQFVRNLNPDGSIFHDFLEYIPNELRQDYVTRILNHVPTNATQMASMGQFEYEWRQAVATGTEKRFAIQGPMLFQSEEGRMNAFEERIGLDYHVPRLASLFANALEHSPSLQARAAEAWTALFLDSLPAGENNVLFSLTQLFFEQTIYNPSFLTSLLPVPEGGLALAAEVCFECAKAELDYRRKTGGQFIPVVKPWERRVFEEFVKHAIELRIAHSPDTALRRLAAKVPLAAIGAASTLQPLHQFPFFGMGGPTNMLAIVLYASDGGNAGLLQRLVADILWKNAPERNAANLESVKTIPTVAEFMACLGAGYRKPAIQEILRFRPTQHPTTPMPRAIDIVSEVERLYTQRYLSPKQDPGMAQLFEALERYAQIVDRTVSDEHGANLSGAHWTGADFIKGDYRQPTVRNILYLGVLLDCSTQGRLDLRRYEEAILELCKITQASNPAIHLSVDSRLDAIPVGMLTTGQALRGHASLKKNRAPLASVQILDPEAGTQALPRAMPTALEAIRNAPQLLIAPEHLHSDLAQILAIPEVRQALQDRKKDPKKSTLILVPLSTEGGTYKTVGISLEEDLRRQFSAGLSEIATAVIINDLSRETSPTLREQFQQLVDERQMTLISISKDLETYLSSAGVPLLRVPLGEIQDHLVPGEGFPTHMKTYAVAPNRLAFALKLFELWHTYHLPPLWLTDIDGTIKKSGRPPLGKLMADLFARILNAGAIKSLATGGAAPVVEEVTIASIKDRLAPLNPNAIRRLLLQAVAGSSLNAANTEGAYEFVAGVVLKDELGPERYGVFLDILKEVQSELFEYHDRKLTIGQINNLRLAHCDAWTKSDPGDGHGFRGDPIDDRKAGITFAVTGKDTPPEVDDYLKARPELNRLIDQVQIYLQNRFIEEGLPLAARRGSPFQVDITLSEKVVDGRTFAMDKYFAIYFLCRLLNWPLGNTIFSGDNIKRAPDGSPRNDTPAAQVAGVVLNAHGRLDMENPEERVQGDQRHVISTTVEGDEDGLAPYGEIYLEFFLHVVPNNIKTELTHRLEEGIANAIRDQYEQSVPWARSAATDFAMATSHGTASLQNVSSFLKACAILLSKGGADEWLQAYQGLQRAALLRLDGLPIRGIERAFRETARRINEKENRRRQAAYREGTLAVATYEPSGSATPITQVESLPQDISSIRAIGEAQFRKGHAGFLLLLGNDSFKPEWLKTRLAEIQILQNRYHTTIPVTIVSGFQNHADTIAFLKDHAFGGLSSNQIDVEFQGLAQSLDPDTRMPFYFFDAQAKNPSRHLHGLGGFDAVMTPVWTGTFARRYSEGMRYALTESQSDPITSAESSVLTLGTMVVSEAELLATVEERRDANTIAAAPYRIDSEDGKSRIVLRPQDVVKPEDRNNALGRVSPYVFSIRALLEKAGAMDASGVLLQMSATSILERIHHWRDLLSRPVVHQSQTSITRAGVGTTLVWLNRILHPMSILSYGLSTALQNPPHRTLDQAA